MQTDTPQPGEREALARIDEGLKLIGRYDLPGMDRWLADQGIAGPISMEPPAWERMAVLITAEVRRLLAPITRELAEAERLQAALREMLAVSACPPGGFVRWEQAIEAARAALAPAQEGE